VFGGGERCRKGAGRRPFRPLAGTARTMKAWVEKGTFILLTCLMDAFGRLSPAFLRDGQGPEGVLT